MGFDKYTPSNSEDLKSKIESYNIKEIYKQREELNQQTGETLKSACKETTTSLISSFIINKKIDTNKVDVKNGIITIEGKNIKTGIDDISIEDIREKVSFDFVEKVFAKENSNREIHEQIALSYSKDFEGIENIRAEREKFNNDIEEFKKYLIEKDPKNEVFYILISNEELKSIWGATQIELAQKLKVIGIEETTSGIEKLLGELNFEGTNGQAIKENWKNANGLLKIGAIGAGLFLGYKTISGLWNHEKNFLNGKMWSLVGAGLLAELVGQVYTGKSYLGMGVSSALDFINGDSNIEDLKKQYKEIDESNEEKKEIKDYPGLALALLHDKTYKEFSGDLSFINENNNDPLIQRALIIAKENGDNVSDLREKIKKGRKELIENLNPKLPKNIKLNLKDLKNVGGENFLEKRKTIIESIKIIKQEIADYLSAENITEITSEEIFNSLEIEKNIILEGGMITYDLGKGSSFDIVL